MDWKREWHIVTMQEVKTVDHWFTKDNLRSEISSVIPVGVWGKRRNWPNSKALASLKIQLGHLSCIQNGITESLWHWGTRKEQEGENEGSGTCQDTWIGHWLAIWVPVCWTNNLSSSSVLHRHYLPPALKPACMLPTLKPGKNPLLSCSCHPI